jgi:hypothetical protein
MLSTIFIALSEKRIPSLHFENVCPSGAYRNGKGSVVIKIPFNCLSP